MILEKEAKLKKETQDPPEELAEKTQRRRKKN